MAVQRIRFVGGEVLTEPAPLKLKRGDEVIFTMEDDSLASVTLSFQPPSPFESSEIIVPAGEQVTLIVKHNVSKRKVRFDATPRLKEPDPPLPLPMPPRPPSKDPPGTSAGDVDVNPDSSS